MNEATSGAGLDKLLQTITESNKQWVEQFVSSLTPKQAETGPEGAPNIISSLVQNTGHVMEMQGQFYKRQMDLWMNMLGNRREEHERRTDQRAPGGQVDRRFNSPEWEQYPFFDYVKQYYLLTSKWMMDLVDGAALDADAKERMSFFTKQYIDAMAPSNFALTNPEVLKLAIETNGESIAEGMKKMAEDFQKGHISMTDESMFEVGRNIAVTPGQVVYENDLFQLLQYTPTCDKVFERPLLIVPPAVNKYYLMDLQPDNSLVRYSVERGYNTFLVSWRNVTAEQGHLTWDDYVEDGFIKAVEVTRDIGKADKVNILGFCIGGVISSTGLTVMKARGLDWVESFTLMTSMIDHSEPGDIKHYLDWKFIQKREAQLAMNGGTGVVSGKELARTFSSLRANDLVWNYVVNNYLKGKTPPPFDLLYWNNDSANLPMPMHTFFIKNMYLENNLAKPGAMTICGVPVDTRTLTMPIYNFAAREDHIVPWHSAYLGNFLVGGPIRFVLGASGHIAGSINPVKNNKRNYWVNDNLVADPEQWLAQAESRPGSWWADWDTWLAPQSGKLVAAPKTLGNRTYKPIEAAPGRYVMAKATVV